MFTKLALKTAAPTDKPMTAADIVKALTATVKGKKTVDPLPLPQSYGFSTGIDFSAQTVNATVTADSKGTTGQVVIEIGLRAESKSNTNKMQNAAAPALQALFKSGGLDKKDKGSTGWAKMRSIINPVDSLFIQLGIKKGTYAIRADAKYAILVVTVPFKNSKQAFTPGSK